MKNPFEMYITKAIEKNNPHILTVDEFKRILDAVDTALSLTANGKGESKNMYRPLS